MSEILWGVDLGGTKIEGAVLQITEDGTPEELCRLRIPTEQEKGYEHVLEQTNLLIQKLIDETGNQPSAIGFGTPGVIDPGTKLLKNSNAACLRGQPLQIDLEKRLGYEITTANDANCFALAESRFGAARKQRCVFGVIMGTGVGGGIVIDDTARYGLQGIAGEFGHVSIDPNGPECYCGKKGCVETFISGPALEKHYEELGGAPSPLEEILERTTEDPTAHAVQTRLVESFGVAISTVINILDPDMVVLGGGLSNIDVLYQDGIREVERCVFNSQLETPIVSNALGDSGGVYGAACLVSKTIQAQ